MGGAFLCLSSSLIMLSIDWLASVSLCSQGADLAAVDALVTATQT
jgi:hypothetical protein